MSIEFTDFCKEYPTVKLSMKKTGGIFDDRFIVLDYGTAKYNSVIAGLWCESYLCRRWNQWRCQLFK